MISLKNVSFAIEGKILLDNCNFSLKKGEKVLLTGPSGGGKSSLLRLMAGLFPPDRGEVFFEDTLLTAKTTGLVRQHVAFVPQEPVLGGETVRESLYLPFRFKANSGRFPDDRTLFDLLNEVNLDPSLLEKREDQISGGEKQRVAIVRALLLEKQVFLADEITSALDKKSMDMVFSLFKRQNMTLFAVSHDDFWKNKTDRCFYLEGGRMSEVCDE
jgi:putative ABC transport system ATP-binding protein